ncbi:EFR1 family ferrodoxin [uncultured Sphaerochaeta sp.]|uniref:EFR1 family ferrodoxin n=1 Tax=uncultured Sphaerochaeta sp. TaxID=886478 RepID=UPI002A0A5E2E|nr:EFR1 family ferrodoxin [uncultured Sphaerochaeta sp.]
MNILILYFSGTGNTRFIAKRLFEALKEEHHEVTLASMEDNPAETYTGYDLYCLGFPVYACTMPENFSAYCQKLALPTTKKVVFFSTLGFYGGNGMRTISKQFIKRGMQPLYAAEIRMPGSDGLVFMKKQSKYVRNLQQRDFFHDKDIEKAIDSMVESISNEKVPTLSQIAPLHLGGVVVGGLMHVSFGLVTNWYKKKFRANDACIGCHLCEKNCPVSNIKVEGKTVHFSDTCIICMRCINNCPAEAIQIGKLTLGTFRWKGPEKNGASV